MPCVDRAKIIAEAAEWNGTMYGHGIQQKRVEGDCSGTVRAIYKAVGIEIVFGAMPSGSGAEGIRNSPSLTQAFHPAPGDVVYWSAPYHHVMIYAGNGYAWGARSTGKTFGYFPLVWFGDKKSQPAFLTSSVICSQ
jgi:cell wall-associated NlpC family hydrolase